MGESAGGGGFATTRWSLVVAAAGSSAESRKALGELFRSYWYPLYAFARRQGRSADDAADVIQGFFAGVIARDDLRAVDAVRGRFRSWLLASLKHFLANEWDRERAQKRGSGAQVLSLDLSDAEARYGREPGAVTEAEVLYERRWALSLLDRALRRLEEECRAEGKRRLFETLRTELTAAIGAAAEGVAPAHAELAQELAMSPGSLKVAVHRIRRRFRDLLREEVADTVDEPAQVDEELKALRRAVAG